MLENITQSIGTVAATLTTLAFVPQAWKSYTTRDLSGISLPTYSMFTVGVALWLIYGILRSDPPIVGSNGITLILALSILRLKIKATK